MEIQLPTVEIDEIRDQAKILNKQMPNSSPELQEIMDVLNIIRHRGK